MREMFRNATSFNRDISNWDVSSVTDMSSMFDDADSFAQNLGRWYIALDSLTISSVDRTVGTISPLSPWLAENHRPTYEAGDDPVSDPFRVNGATLLLKPGRELKFGSHHVSIKATGTDLFGATPTTETVRVLALVTFKPLTPFITVWEATDSDRTITIPVGGSTSAYWVDWGGGSTTSYPNGGDATPHLRPPPVIIPSLSTVRSRGSILATTPATPHSCSPSTSGGQSDGPAWRAPSKMPSTWSTRHALPPA